MPGRPPTPEEAVAAERKAIVNVFLAMAKDWRKKARMYASRSSGHAYGIAATCQAHAKECEMAADVVSRRR